MTNSLAAFLYAERQQESGGNYSSVNSGSGALGAYQVMPANVASWTKRALGHSITPQQFLASRSAQDAVANTILGGYYSKYGPAGAAAMWYSGQPDPNKTYGNPPVYHYVASVLALMGTSAAAGAGVPGTGGTGGTDTPTDGTTGTTGSATDTVSTASDDTHPDCLWGMSLPVVGYTCILTKGTGRALLGSLLMVSAAIVGGAGLIILAAYGLKKSGALETAASAAAVVPGVGGAAAKLAGGAAALKSGPKPKAAPKPPAKPKAAPAKKAAPTQKVDAP